LGADLPHPAEDSKPLCIFVSVGDGNIISGLHKGFKDLVTLGWLNQMPRIFGVQSEKSAAIAKAFFATRNDHASFGCNPGRLHQRGLAP
jgi:threonine synthase